MRLGTPFRRSGPRLCRGGVVLVSLLGYLAALLGYPMPGRAVRSAGKPFPCQHHACGCVDAEQCWRGCCCYSPAQKLAWAEAHHVTPPAYAELDTGESQLAGHKDSDDHDHLAGREHGGPCGHGVADHDARNQDACNHGTADRTGADPQIASRAPRQCCGQHASRQVAGATGAESSPAGAASPAADSLDDDGSVQYVSGDAWRRCRGLPTLWVSSGAALPAPAAVGWQFSWDVVEWLSTGTPALYGGILAPPVPPPRV